MWVYPPTRDPVACSGFIFYALRAWPPRRPTIAPKPILARSKSDVTVFSRSGGGDSPAIIVVVTQMITNNNVPPAAVRNTNLNAEVSGVREFSTLANWKAGSSLQTYLPRLVDQTETRPGVFAHSAAMLAMSCTMPIVVPFAAITHSTDLNLYHVLLGSLIVILKPTNNSTFRAVRRIISCLPCRKTGRPAVLGKTSGRDRHRA
jgi:hypothetical protein